jgi:hypothetical protein
VININDDNLFKQNFLFYEKRLKPNGTFETYLEINENNQDHTIKWSILKHAISYTGGSKGCNLCLEEKFCILKDINKDNLLNKRSRHKNRFRVNKVVNKIL